MRIRRRTFWFGLPVHCGGRPPKGSHKDTLYTRTTIGYWGEWW